MVAQLDKIFHAFCGNWRFSTVFIKANSWTESQAGLIQLTHELAISRFYHWVADTLLDYRSRGLIILTKFLYDFPQFLQVNHGTESYTKQRLFLSTPVPVNYSQSSFHSNQNTPRNTQNNSLNPGTGACFAGCISFTNRSLIQNGA